MATIVQHGTMRSHAQPFCKGLQIAPMWQDREQGLAHWITSDGHVG